jgi:hypothetical protein
MISPEVMDMLHARSQAEYRAANPNTDLEMMNADMPGQFWQTPMSEEEMHALALKQIARQYITGKSQLASTNWNAAVYNNRQTDTVTNTDTLGASATSHMPAAAQFTSLPAMIQDPQLIDPASSAPQDSLDYTDDGSSDIVGFKNPGQQLLTPPPAVMDNINSFVSNLGGAKKTRAANPQSAIKKAAQNRLQAGKTLGGVYSKGGGQKTGGRISLGGKY